MAGDSDENLEHLSSAPVSSADLRPIPSRLIIPSGSIESIVINPKQDLSEWVHDKIFCELEMFRAQTPLINLCKRVMNAVDLKDNYTETHCLGVFFYSFSVFLEYQKAYPKIPAIMASNVKFGGLLHDFGKIRIPDSILKKEGPLTDSEWKKMKEHTLVGERRLLKYAAAFGKIPQFKHQTKRLVEVAPIIRSHHERYDGSGYPYGLVEEQIPVESLIIGIADTFDALTTKRCYREKVYSVDEAVKVISNERAKFGDAVYSAFMSSVKVLREIQKNYLSTSLDFLDDLRKRAIDGHNYFPVLKKITVSAN